MKATEAKLLEFLKKSPQFLVPIYQRTYSWTERECRQMWHDILSAGRNDKVAAYFIGSIVYVEEGLYNISSQSPLLVIDGQQRLTTLTLIIEALARFVGNNEPLDGFSARKLRNYYVLNPLEDGERRYKLLLSETDRASLIALLESQPQPTEKSVRLTSNFALFEEWLAIEKDAIADICRGLAKLVIVDISLSRDQDNPQLIFESLNSTGRELSQADLIRNFVLMGLKPTLQRQLYNNYWRPMELEFGQEAYASRFDGFVRHYLTVKTGNIPNVGETYDAFKEYARSSEAGDVDDLVRDIHRFAKFFCRVALGAESDSLLYAAFHDIRELKVDVAYPLLLDLYHDYEEGVLLKADLERLLRLVESYVFRRQVCSIPTNSLNKTFSTFAKALKRDRYLESAQAHFLTLPSYRRFPSDNEFKESLQSRDMYTFPRRSYWLRRLENYGRKERVPVDEYTIEHIMPQNENLPLPWRQMLGADWERVHSTYIHRLGNLTLTGYNSEFGDRPFLEKRDMKGGFAVSPLYLNEGLGALNAWDENAILERSERLATLALEVWGSPKLDPAVVAIYLPKAPAATYTIADHVNVAGGPMHDVFEALRAEVKALDPCVTEEVLKYYIAYKAETNFVDVIPQAKRLLLTLNSPFNDIDDPLRACKDVTGLGAWGNGDVQVGLSGLDQLPYVMGLIRQSFEQQMANSAGDC